MTVKHPEADQDCGHRVTSHNAADPGGQSPLDAGRRAFVGVAAGVTAAVVAPGVFLHAVQAAVTPRTTPVTDAVRWGLLVDTSKCAADCRACVDACNKENGLDLQTKPEGQTAAAWEDQKAVGLRKVKL